MGELVYAIGMSAAAVSAITGALKAGRKPMDLFGAAAKSRKTRRTGSFILFRKRDPFPAGKRELVPARTSRTLGDEQVFLHQVSELARRGGARGLRERGVLSGGHPALKASRSGFEHAIERLALPLGQRGVLVLVAEASACDGLVDERCSTRTRRRKCANQPEQAGGGVARVALSLIQPGVVLGAPVAERLREPVQAVAEPRNQTAAIVAVCAWAHAEWVRIHPFANGNGRTARLWANSLAMRYGLPAFVHLRPRPEGDYDVVSEQALRGDWEPAVAVFLHLLEDFRKDPGPDT